MKKTIFAALIMLCFCIPQAQAYVLTATLTADNHYALFYGNATGSVLNFVGRNEALLNGAGNPGQYNWSQPETFSFDVSYTDRIYLVAWDDTKTANSWIGQFTAVGMDPFFSNTADWQSKVGTGVNPGETGDPVFATIQADIAAGGWNTPAVSASNGSSPWGFIPGISADADFIWNDTFSSPNANVGHYAIFTRPVPTPEPATMALFGLGLGGLGLLRRKQQI